jgi:23S rRNA-/tRNA-specific pseudouridylate synthase
MFPIDILFQDNYILVVNKPTALSMFADRVSPSSLWDMLKNHFQDRSLYQVHRIDKETSGVVILAFSKKAQAQLNRQFVGHTIKKVYLAICLGQPDPPSGFIDLPLRPGRKNSFRVAGPRETIFLDTSPAIPTWKLPSSTQSLTSNNKSYPSQTFYQTVASDGRYSLLVVQPITGRTHQIRVHLSWIGHQLLGDPLYGKPGSSTQRAERLALHSFQLQFIENWIDGQEPTQRLFQAPIPAFFEDFLAHMNRSNGYEKLDLQKEINSILATNTQIPTGKE